MTNRASPTAGRKIGAISASRSFVRGHFPLPVLLAFVAILLMAFIAIGATALAPYDIASMDLRMRLIPPAFSQAGTWKHMLGTDQLGRDVLSRLMMSVRISLSIAVISTLIAATLGIVSGFAAAHFRGRVEQAILMMIDIQAALPFMIVAITILAFFGNGLTLFTLLLGLFGWERIARLSRGVAISAMEQGYSLAVFDLGASPLRVYVRHVLPNVASTLIVAMTLNLPEVILLESSLSFLGLGVQPPMPSLGSMVGLAREYLQSAPWLVLVPSLAIVLITLSISIIGDWLRDRLDVPGR
ncbi:ABC transporter permease [Rhizobium sp. ZPR3]|uniref:ABC transporter permease n=2 Tax=unclassified Rhizobium TaxID=2613769 RepID=A0AAU7SRJ3_9HYPH